MDQDGKLVQKAIRTIDDLPEEILLMILKLLDQESLPEASLTCKMWRSLAVDKISWAKTVWSLNELKFFLKALPNLKTIEMVGLLGDLSKEDDPLTTSQLSKLKNLHLCTYNSAVLRFLNKAQLETFLQNVYLPTEIGNFLAGQKNLTNLISSGSLFRTPIAAENVPFRLKELSLSNFLLDESGCNNMLAFMKLHEDTLETLKLGRHFSGPIFEYVFAKLKKLKKLYLEIDGLKICENWLERFEVNQSVTTLVLFEKWRNCTSYQVTQIIRHLPNIESLVLLLYQPYNKLSAVLDDLKQLKHLTIKTFDRQFWQNVTFPKLESLRLVNAKLEHGSDIAFVAKNLNLRSLVFDGNVDDDFIDAISENFPKLESLDLDKSNFNANITSHIRGLRLREKDFFEHFEYYENFLRHGFFGLPVESDIDNAEIFDLSE